MADTVFVGCKLPSGIHLDIGDKRVTLVGSNAAVVIGGHGITENVDKQFFDKWMSLYKDSAMVTGGFIFSHGKTNSVQAEAKDKANNRNGFEGMNPDAPAPGVTVVKED